MLSDAVSIVNNPVVYSAFKVFALETSNQFLVKFIDRIHKEYMAISNSSLPYVADSVSRFFSLKPTVYKVASYCRSLGQSFGLYSMIGQLSKKEEAAGKIRVFAMVDG